MNIVREMLAAVVLIMLSGFSLAQELSDQQAAPAIEVVDPAEAIDEVLVVGEQPGPGLWRVYKGDHVLWVLGTLSPISKDMQWHSKQVEEAAASSQEYLTGVEVKLEVGFWSKLSLLPSLIGIKDNPDGKRSE